MDKKSPAKPLHVEVAEKIIEALKKGTPPWQRPWDAEGMQALLPYNFQSGKRYHGINALSLLTTERQDPRWMTYKQAEDSGFQVRKGERSTTIQFIKTSDERNKRDAAGRVLHDELGKPIKEVIALPNAIVRNAYVFNATQIDGVPELEKTKAGYSWDPIEKVDKLIKASGADISHHFGNRAFYDLSKDAITLPYKSWFSDNHKYYGTLLHELGHWTGHPERLDRDLGGEFGSEQYAREELRAELASMLMGQDLGIAYHPDQHHAYLKDWISVLENNPFEIFSASMDAEKIVGYIMDLDRSQEVLPVVEEVHSKLQAGKASDYLTTGDQIAYKNSVYQVVGHLKQGRLKMQESLGGNVFSMSKEDNLYGTLLSLKKEASINLQEASSQSLDQRSDEQNFEQGR